MENEVQKQILVAASKTSESMSDRYKTGIEPSMDEDDIKEYIQFVMKEVSKRPNL